MGKLAERLNDRVIPIRCKVGDALDATCEDDEDREVAASVSAEDLAADLREQGYEVSASLIRSHRRGKGECRCGRAR